MDQQDSSISPAQRRRARPYLLSASLDGRGLEDEGVALWTLDLKIDPAIRFAPLDGLVRAHWH